jgi:hypothetical protein
MKHTSNGKRSYARHMCKKDLKRYGFGEIRSHWCRTPRMHAKFVLLYRGSAMVPQYRVRSSFSNAKRQKKGTEL